MNTKTEHEIEVAIIGGGVAGCIAAIALAESHSVVLIDKLSEPAERLGECLAPAARRILKRLNLLTDFERTIPSDHPSLHLKSMGMQSYWGSEQVHVVDPLRNPDGFGWHVDRRAFEVYLREAAVQRGVECFWPMQLHNTRYADSRWYITAVSGDKAGTTYNFRAKFVIDASGRQSHFARKLGVERQHFDKLVAYWATLPDYETNKMSTISASELGWWYSAPLPNNKRVIVLQTDSDLVDKRIKNCDQFIELARANREMAGILERNHGEIRFQKTAAANSTRLQQVAGQQWAALGDAATSFDPLSSQGMFNAMAGALQLTDLILESGFTKDLCPDKMLQFQAAYTNQIDQIWQHYLKHKRIYYGQERRWEDAAFWRRRQ
ncbi:MAG: NAD(P)/FAD-dependent oxidoreductase [Flavipsychrobacter sp.]|nr:NAD(P)/FAD-dependent oxidoreductase [Flavipsychrobacter sp.]